MSEQISWPYRMQPGSQELAWKLMNPNAGIRRVGFGGPKGGGKSYFARATAFTLTYQMPIVVCIVRSRLKVLKRNHIKPAQNELRDFMDQKLLNYNDQDKMFTWKHTGGIVYFAHCETDGDVEQFDGIPADLYIFEEAGHFTKDTLQGIWKNCRSTDLAINRGAHYVPKVLCTFNWGGKGHSYLRRIFWDKIYEEKERPEDYFFVFAPLDQNKALMQADPFYQQTLSELPEQLREGYLLGDPDAFSGTVFTVVDDVHDVDPYEVLRPHGGVIPPYWDFIGSVDTGTGGTWSFGLYAITPERQKYKICEYYSDKLNPREHVENIHWMITNENSDIAKWTQMRPPDYIVSDKFAFGKHERFAITSTEHTIEGLFNEKGYYLYQVNHPRVPSIRALMSALHFEFDDGVIDLEPELKFFKGMCPNTKEELKAAEYDKKNPDDIDHSPNVADHAIDETRNLLMVAASPPAKADIPDQVVSKGEYGHHKELRDIEEADYEDIAGSFGGNGVDF